MEIERKFVIKKIPYNLEDFPSNFIMQGYLASRNPDVERRVRKKGDRFFFTKKSKGSLTREEEEKEITKTEFLKLWKLTENRRIEKTRYEIGLEKFIIELDVYQGNLKGLVIAEVEFYSEEEARKFPVPSWFGREVTEDNRYKNRNLALLGFPKP